MPVLRGNRTTTILPHGIGEEDLTLVVLYEGSCHDRPEQGHNDRNDETTIWRKNLFGCTI